MSKDKNQKKKINNNSNTFSDTNCITHLNALGWELMYSNPDTAIILGNQALAILNEAENFSKVSNFEKVKHTNRLI